MVFFTFFPDLTGIGYFKFDDKPIFSFSHNQMTGRPRTGRLRDGAEGEASSGKDDSEGVLRCLRQMRYPRRRFFRQSGPKKSEPLAGNASKAFLDCVSGAPQRMPLLS